MSLKYEEIAKQLCELLNISEDSEHEQIDEAFTRHLTRLINNFPEDFSEEDEIAAKEDLRHIVATYCDYNYARLQFKHGTMSEKNSQDHEEGIRIKAKAKGMQHGIKTVMIEYLETSLDINLALHHIDIRMADLLENQNGSIDDFVPVQYNQKLCERIAFMRKQNLVLEQYREELKTVEEHLIKLDVIFTGIEKLLNNMVGEKKTKTFLHKIQSALKNLDFKKSAGFFTKAEQDYKKKFVLLKKSKETQEKNIKALQEAARLLASFIRKNETALHGRSPKLFTQKKDLQALYKRIDQELVLTDAFLNQHEIPELLFRKNALSEQKERLRGLMAFSSLKNLCEILQDRLLSPIKTLGDVRKMEIDIIDPMEKVFNDSRQFKFITESVAGLGQNPDENSVSEKNVWDSLKPKAIL